MWYALGTEKDDETAEGEVCRLNKKKQNLIVLIICALAVVFIVYALGAVFRYKPEETGQPEQSETVPQESESVVEPPQESQPADEEPQQSQSPQEEPEVLPPERSPEAEPSVQPTPEPTPELTPSSTPAPTPTPTLVPTPEPTLVPPPEAVDPASKTLPDLQVFLNRTPSIDRGYFSNGREFQFINMPFDAWKTVEQELVALLQEPRYQLELIESGSKETASSCSTYYNFRYTGTASDITLLRDKDDIRSAHMHLKVYGHESNQSFAVRLVLCDAFELEDPGSRTTQNVGKSNVGGSDSYTPDSGNTFTPEASRLDCLTCRGDGDCNTCGGDGYTGFGDAKAGCRTCHGNGKCTACGGTGKR